MKIKLLKFRLKFCIKTRTKIPNEKILSPFIEKTGLTALSIRPSGLTKPSQQKGAHLVFKTFRKVLEI